jgi:hypothetical protein
VSVIGTGDGAYTLDTFMRFNETKKLPFIHGTTKKDAVDTFTITVSDDPEDDGNITKQISISIDPLGPFDKIVNPQGANVIPIAIYSTPTFDVANLNAETVFLGPEKTTPFNKGQIKDLNGDGMNDQKLFFKKNETGISPETDTLCLESADENGIALKGCDEVEVMTLEDFVLYLKSRR